MSATLLAHQQPAINHKWTKNYEDDFQLMFLLISNNLSLN
jgi:hypothetical protein